ncbi:MerR family transcriptional regulator [Pseudomonas chlororaphis]|uniref:Helix-turn-helix-type transcriptional regulator n=1 Tax=Pseudomonas chlororaphis TaxID=587753 RepID=A0A1Q8EVV7_9PSED|nr:MerR family transcriptional regulator [Pseudomonas chlororaphis]OLF55938.1 helix-turn-helix-type transcriptional regulator [Pseudomonas chlororaphis]
MPVITELSCSTQPLDDPSQDDLFPIREVSRLTGINPVTLRAWERRYGLIQPTRTESGHRLYSMLDVETVREILGWIDRGVAVSKVGKIIAKTRAAREAPPLTIGASEPGDYRQWQGQLKRAIGEFDEPHLERLYGQIFSSYPLAVVFQDILMPFWKQLAQQQESYGHASEWLFFDHFLRVRILQRLLLQRGAGQARPVLLAALAGQGRELELLVAALMLGSAEVEVRVLAPGQPFDELTLVCEKIKPQALVLFSNHAPATELPRRLNRLAMTLDCPLLLAGDVAELAQDSLNASPVGCLGNDGRLMMQRLRQFLSGTLDT